ncbi:MAG TPA: chromosome segregation protein SMC [Thermoflexales bacterium]|nr:chromosome segregation protein SMC [Thermoflexales bacterium]
MRLKKVTLSGYKTFASRQAFEFGAGITAVIGPNGSGKSNVADGVRWALGEQSYSLLRGKRTDDMIYSGSTRRPRASMAEVLLTFDNSDGFFPIEFSEIEIGRRAFRDGANEYLLNGNKVRLRDIGDLLSHTGLAERTYTVIGQGMVDDALAQKPEERRALFEEAAGIGAYRDRREDAHRKLEETRGNLQRARDILAEITPRLSQLERQAHRARQYQTLAAELETLTRAWFGIQARAQREAIARHGEARDWARAHVAAALAAVRARDEAGEALRATLADLRGQIATLQPQRDEARRAAEQFSRELAVARERDRAFASQLSDVERETGSRAAALDGHGLRVAQAAAMAMASQSRLDSMQHALAIAQRAATERQTARNEMEAARAAAQTELLRLNSATSAAQNKVTAARSRQAQLHRQTGDVQARNEALNAQRERELQTVARIDPALEQDATRMAALQAAHDETVRAHDAARAALSAAQTAHATAEAEERMTQRFSVFAEMRAQQGSDDLLAAAQAAKLPGLAGALGTLIQVRPDDKRAVEAALGEQLKAVIVETEEGVTGIRHWLAHRNTQGRLLVLPLGSIRSSVDSGELGERAFALGAWPLMDMISAPSWLRPLLQVVAGRAFVARDLDAARALAAQLPEGCQFVTRDGECVCANGVLTLPAGERRPIVLGGDTETAEPEPSAGWISPEDAKARAAQTRVARDAAQRALEAARRKSEESARAQDAFTRETAHRRAQRDDITRRIARIEEQLVQAMGDIARIEQEQADVLPQLEAAASDAQQAEVAQGEAAARLADLETELRGQLQLSLFSQTAAEAAPSGPQATARETGWVNTLNAAFAAVASANEAVRNAEGARRERLASLAEGANARDAAARRTIDLSAKIAPARNALAALGDAERDAAARISALDQALAPLTRQARATEAEAIAEDTRARETDRALREAESKLNAAELELLRHQDELAALRQRVVDALAGEDGGPSGADTADALESLPSVESLPAGTEERITQLRGQIRRLGAINAEAQVEYDDLAKRHEFLTTQCDDLDRASISLQQVIAELNDVMKATFRQTFDAIAGAFQQTFKVLFGGGQAKLTLVNADNIDESGVEIQAQPPGKRPQTLALLSGGERSLTATALLFAILRIKPTPFCVLDEVDAALDEANIVRIRSMLESLSDQTQFIVITHNRGTVEAASTIYGISMGADGASTVLSLQLEDVK